MIEFVARAATRSWIVDAGRCTAKGNSAPGTGPFGGCRSCAARRLRGVVGVVESVIYYQRREQASWTDPLASSRSTIASATFVASTL